LKQVKPVVVSTPLIVSYTTGLGEFIIKMVYKQYKVNNKVVGSLEGKNYYTTRVPRLHYFVKAQGYPISTMILYDLVDNDCEYVYVKELGKNVTTVYRICVYEYLKGERIKEDGYDEQRCVPLKSMEKCGL
jgi:hypothetical protein